MLTLTAQAEAGAIELRWNAVTGAARYRLWSWRDAATGWQEIGGDDLKGLNKHEHLIAGATYHYLILAVDAGGEQVARSERISDTVPGGLAAPTLTAQAAAGAVELRWDAVTGAARYRLWSWWDAATGWQEIGGDDLKELKFSTRASPWARPTTTRYRRSALPASGVLCRSRPLPP